MNPLEYGVVRQLWLGVLALFVCLLAVAGGAAHAAKPKQAVFRVTLTATLTKDWTFTRVQGDDGECTETTRGVGRWVAKLSAKPTRRVRAISAGGGRVRFTGAPVAAITGSATLSGTTTNSTGGQPPCERSSRSVRCGQQRRTFKGGSSALRSPRRGVLQLGSVRGPGPARSFSTCLEEPADIRAIRTDLPLATGPLAAEDVFGRNVSRFFISGDTEQVTTIEGELAGRVTERVRWTVVFTRLAR